jgi:hypothetical protein
MNLYHISQTSNTDYDSYDSYDSAVVAASSKMAASRIHPSPFRSKYYPATDDWGEALKSDWCQSASQVTVVYIGKAKSGTKAGVICASFNAG